MSTAVLRSRRVGAALAALTAVALPAATPAHAARATSATCVHQFTSTITPGFTVTPSSGTQTTHGETGTIACVGRLAGHRITGPGSVGYDLAHRGATCLSLTASGGTVRITIPTTAGRKHFAGVLSVRRTALAVSASAQFPGFRYRGNGVAIPKQGMCPITPLRQALIVLTGSLSNS